MWGTLLYTGHSGYIPYDSDFLRDPPAFCISLRRLRSVYRPPDLLCTGIQKSAETEKAEEETAETTVTPEPTEEAEK